VPLVVCLLMASSTATHLNGVSFFPLLAAVVGFGKKKGPNSQ
jgi:hypothetical protein